jgi:hypothetical protein
MGRQSIVADSRSEFFDDVPNQFLGHSVAPGLARAVHLSEELSRVDARRCHPLAEGAMNPIGHRDGAHMAALADHVDDCPMPFTLLQMIHR